MLVTDTGDAFCAGAGLAAPAFSSMEVSHSTEEGDADHTYAALGTGVQHRRHYTRAQPALRIA